MRFPVISINMINEEKMLQQLEELKHKWNGNVSSLKPMSKDWVEWRMDQIRIKRLELLLSNLAIQKTLIDSNSGLTNIVQ